MASFFSSHSQSHRKCRKYFCGSVIRKVLFGMFQIHPGCPTGHRVCMSFCRGKHPVTHCVRQPGFLKHAIFCFSYLLRFRFSGFSGALWQKSQLTQATYKIRQTLSKKKQPPSDFCFLTMNLGILFEKSFHNLWKPSGKDSKYISGTVYFLDKIMFVH